MEFVFVENATIRNGESRKLIRKHCMKGKNLGKVRVKPAEIEDISSLKSSKLDTDSREDGYLIMRSALSDRFATFCFPSKLEPRMHDLLYRFLTYSEQSLYPQEYCLPKSKHDYLMLSYLLSDEAFFHCVLAMAAGFHVILGHQNSSKEMLRHLANTYRCVNRNLTNSEIPSDSTVATVMSMAIHEELLGQTRRGRVHMDALLKMVTMRGGLESFEEFPLLLEKICRVDLEYALQNGWKPSLRRDKFPYDLVRALIEQHDVKDDILKSINGIEEVNDGLQRIYWDVASVSCLLTRGLVKLQPTIFQEILLSILYRLLHLQHLSELHSMNKVDPLWHLSLLAFMTAMLFRPASPKRLAYGLLASHYRSHFENISDNASKNQRMIFWALFVGGISVLQDDDMIWLLPHIKSIASSAGIVDWKGAREWLHSYPWIDVFHEKPAQELWDKVESS